MHLPLFEGALAALSPVAGKSLLDAGCGSGLFLALAQQAGARATGLDAAEGLAEIARGRAPGADVRVGDLEQLPFDGRSFDLVTAFNSLQYAADPRAALRELGRVCKADGRILVGTWSDPARNQTDPLFARLRQLAPPPPGTPAPLGLASAGHLEMRMVEAGLGPVGWGEAEAPFEYGSVEEAWLAMASSGPVVRACQVAGEDAVRRAAEDFFKASAGPDGRVRQMNVFRWVVARPASG